MTAVRARSPERPTLIERIILGLRLPYSAGALVFALLFPAARLVLFVVESADLAEAIDRAFVQPEGVPLLQRVGIQVLQVAVAFYAFWVIRYMRRKAAAAEKDVAPLLQGGREAYRDTLAALSRTGPPILIGALILGPGVLLSGPPTRLVEVLLFLPLNAILFVAYGTAAWVYFYTLGGLNRLLKKPMRLKPFYEDRLLGTRPLGMLCLALAAALFGLMALLMLQFPLAPVPDPLPVVVFNILALGIPVTVGAVAISLPLSAVHRELVRAKQTEQAFVQRKFGDALGSLYGEGPGAPQPSLADVHALVAADLAERRIAAIPSWPVDTEIVGKFAVAMMTLVAAVLARIILYVLQF